MSAKVFLSCGQNKDSAEEMAAVNAIQKHLIEDFCMDVFVATGENFLYGSSSILNNLRNSDYYLFINFERPVEITSCYCSLYTHQELAVAFAFGFDESNMLLFHKKGMRKSGIFEQIIANGEFNTYSDVVDVVIKGVRDKHWSSSYSRHLILLPLQHSLHVGQRAGQFNGNDVFQEQTTLVNIKNQRNDCAAINCQVHLKRIGEIVNQQTIQRDNIDRNPVKASGVKAYSQTIGPGETASFDLFVFDCQRNQLFMRTESDVITTQGLQRPLITKEGEYILSFEVIAQQFPLLTFDVRVQLGDGVEGGINVSLQEDNQAERLEITNNQKILEKK